MILWNALATHDEDGNPLFTPADLDVLHEGALAACDADDGLEDGIIGGDPRTCAFDPAALTCEPGQRSGCLSPVQVEGARKVYEGPVTSKGEKLSKYFPFYPATARLGEGYLLFHGSPGIRPITGSTWVSIRIRGRAGRRTDFDFDHDYKRTGMMDADCEWLQQSRSA